MKILNYITFFTFIFLSFSANAQTKKELRNDKLSHSEIIKKFEKTDDKTLEIKRKLAESYYETGNYFKSEDYYAEIIESGEYKSDDIYKYAFVLAVNQQYSESEKWMDVFYELNKNDGRAKLYAENKGFYNILLQDKE